jgi:hypothetical protein
MWTEPDAEGGKEDDLEGGRFMMDVARKRAPLAAAAPGMR